MLLEIEDSDGFPALNEEIAIKVQSFWRDPAIQVQVHVLDVKLSMFAEL